MDQRSIGGLKRRKVSIKGNLVGPVPRHTPKDQRELNALASRGISKRMNWLDSLQMNDHKEPSVQSPSPLAISQWNLQIVVQSSSDPMRIPVVSFFFCISWQFTEIIQMRIRNFRLKRTRKWNFREQGNLRDFILFVRRFRDLREEPCLCFEALCRVEQPRDSRQILRDIPLCLWWSEIKKMLKVI